MANTITKEQFGGKDHVEFGLDVGTTPAFPLTGSQATVVVHPDGGGTIKVQATWSLPSKVGLGTARWIDWDAGAVAVATSAIIYGATALRFVTATAAGAAEVSQ
jgi:hypothetical protein